MAKYLTRQTLRGVWCALITPWTDKDELDAKRYKREIRAYEGTGVHGIYTGGTTGEFYAQDDETYERVTEITCDEGHGIGLPVQIGATALSTRVARQRIRTALKYGADAIQIALPFWLQTRDDEAMQFCKDIAKEAGKVPIILYLTSRSKRKMTPEFLGEVADAVPTVIGTKDTGCDIPTLKQFVKKARGVAVFGGDTDFLEKLPVGGKGGYCSCTGLNTKRIVEYYELCATGRLKEAMPIHKELQGLIKLYIRWQEDEGLMDSAIDRIQRVAGGIDVGVRCQRPYLSGSQKHVNELIAWCKKNAPKLLER